MGLSVLELCDAQPLPSPSPSPMFHNGVADPLLVQVEEERPGREGVHPIRCFPCTTATVPGRPWAIPELRLAPSRI